MNQWSIRRKRIIVLAVSSALFFLVGVPSFFLFYRAPTCTDLKMNGDETGVDCGGSCQLLCSVESLPIISRGDARVLTVATTTTGGFYEVAALFDNPNVNAEAVGATYTIKIFSPSGTEPVMVIEGETYVPKSGEFAVFEGPFELEGVEPSRAVFEWQSSSLAWRKNDSPPHRLAVLDTELTGADNSPRLQASVENSALETVSNIELVALVRDADGNIFAASKTFISSLSGGESQPIVFTWPRPFERGVAGTEIIIRVFPDRSFIR